MSGYNLPPGCAVSDVPGHRPEDMKQIELAEKFEEQLDALIDDFKERGLSHETITETLNQ